MIVVSPLWRSGELDRHRQAVGVESGRDRRGGLPDVVPGRRVADVRAALVERAQCPGVDRDVSRRWRGCRGGGHHEVVVIEHRGSGASATSGSRSMLRRSARPPSRRPIAASRRVRRSRPAPCASASSRTPAAHRGVNVTSSCGCASLYSSHLVTERSEQLGGLLDRRNRLARRLDAWDRRFQRHGDPQPPGLATGRCRERTIGLRQLGPRTGERPADRVVEQRDVENAAPEPSERSASVPVVAQRRERDPAALRLEPEQPAERRGDPDRAATV